jgi:hypothetical protein
MQSLLLERRYFAWGETFSLSLNKLSNILALHLILLENQNKERAE